MRSKLHRSPLMLPSLATSALQSHLKGLSKSTIVLSYILCQVGNAVYNEGSTEGCNCSGQGWAASVPNASWAGQDEDFGMGSYRLLNERKRRRASSTWLAYWAGATSRNCS